MSINFTLLAQNSSDDYVRQAYLCALSIRATNPGSKIALITNNECKYDIFDDVIKIPWGDEAENSAWKIENRWKIYHITPYTNTIVLDTDMLVLDNIDHWWDALQQKKIFYTTNVLTYRGDPITSTYYRKSFVKNNLPSLYSGFHYFEKSKDAHLFYQWLELVMKNWEVFYKQHATGKIIQEFPSVDVSAAIVTKILGWEQVVTDTNCYPNFVHMKSHAQDWKSPKDSWINNTNISFNKSLDLKIGNYRQQGIFHYTEKNFATDNIIKIYEEYLGI
jgi:hypothetical protein